MEGLSILNEIFYFIAGALWFTLGFLPFMIMLVTLTSFQIVAKIYGDKNGY